jgi:hypothetical protein
MKEWRNSLADQHLPSYRHDGRLQADTRREVSVVQSCGEHHARSGPLLALPMYDESATLRVYAFHPFIAHDIRATIAERFTQCE